MKKIAKRSIITLILFAVLAGVFWIFWTQLEARARLEHLAGIKTANYGRPAHIEQNAADCQAGLLDCGIISYLEKNIAISSHGGKNFCVYELFNDIGQSPLYAYVLCEEFYIGGSGKIYEGSGTAGPAKISKENENMSVWRPRDGSQFWQDMADNFPEQYRQEAQDFSIQRSEMLLQTNRQRAEKFFGAEFDYTVEKTLDQICGDDTECQTPGEYLALSRCQFTSMCLQGKCTVICPKLRQN
jgi:hypothetical protein